MSDRGTGALESLVSDFLAKVQVHHSDRLALRPKALKKRIIRLIDAGLPPYRRPAGRPKLNRITTATQMYERQKAEVKAGTRKATSWHAIAQECIPKFSEIKTDYRRMVALKRLRDAVHARRGRKRKDAHS